jgi:hypothetical protein
MLALRAHEVDPFFPKQATDHRSPLPSLDDNSNEENNLSTPFLHLKQGIEESLSTLRVSLFDTSQHLLQYLSPSQLNKRGTPVSKYKNLEKSVGTVQNFKLKSRENF